MNEIPQMATINEVAETFNLSKNFVRSLCLQNKVIFVRAGKKYLLNIPKFAEFLNNGENKDLLREQP